MAENTMRISNTLVNDDSSGKLGYARQIYDDKLEEFQGTLNEMIGYEPYTKFDPTASYSKDDIVWMEGVDGFDDGFYIFIYNYIPGSTFPLNKSVEHYTLRENIVKRIERVFDGGRADSEFGGTRNVDAGHADNP